MKKFHQVALNYVGQIRLYSFIDLFYLMIAIHSPKHLFVGGVLLWIGFLIFLESQHQNTGRKPFPKGIWPVLWLLGLIIFWRPEGLLFILFGYLYTRKNFSWGGLLSPIFRGLQIFLLVGAVIGYHNYFTWLAGGIILTRNLLGDVRDTAKDIKHGRVTIPVALGLKKGNRYVHLLAVMAATLVWCIYGRFEIEFLIIAWLVEIGSYNLTAR